MDLIDRQDAIDDLKDMYHAAEKWGEEASDDVTKARAESCMASLIEMKLRIEKLPSAQPEVHDRNVGEWDMFELITSVWYGKQCYFVEENGVVYSRVSGKYMSVDEAIKEFLGRIGDNE